MTIGRHVRRHRADAGSVLILIVLTVWFSRGMVWDGQVPFFRDLNTYFYPLRFALAQAFKEGQLPLWDRHFAMGFPILADFQSGAFYPPHLFFLVLPFFQAIRIIYFSHYLIAVIGGYLLGRQWKLQRYEAMIGALVFTLGGTTISLINLLNHFQCAVWLPWTILFWERYLTKSTWRNFFLLTLFLTVQFLAGSPEIYLMSMALLLLDGLRIHAAHGLGAFLRTVGGLVGANLLVGALVAVQLLPTIELIFESRRQEAIPFQEALSWSFNPWRLINLFFLDKKVNLALGDGTQLFFDRDVPLFVSNYFGAIFVCGIGFWLYASSVREKTTVGLLVIVSLILACGSYTPIYPLLYQNVAVFRTFRYPEKIFFLTQAILIVAVLKGISRFHTQDSRRANKMLMILGTAFGVFFLLYVLLRFQPSLLLDFILRQKALAIPPSWTLDNVASVLVNLERQLLLMAALLGLFWVAKNGYLKETVFKFLLVAVVFVDLNDANQSFQYLLDPQSVMDGRTVIQSPADDPSRVFYYPSGKNLHAGAFVIRRPPTTPFSQIYAIVANNLLPNSGVYLGFDYMQDINALAKESYLQFLRFANQLEPARQFRLLGALNVKYVTSFRPLSAEGITLVRHLPEYPSWVYKIDGVVPRAHIVYQTKVETEPRKILEYISSDRFNPFKEVLLDKSLLNTSENQSEGTAKITNYRNQEVRINTSSKTSGVLVLADSFYPGWHVYIDGNEEELLKANYFFRAVKIRAGEHTVEFKYEPYWFSVGRWISIFTIVALAVVCGYFGIKRRFLLASTKVNEVSVPALSASMSLHQGSKQ